MTLDELDQLREWMLANGAVYARVGEVALTLGEQPPKELPDDHPLVQLAREKAIAAEVRRRMHVAPEDDPELYGREPGEEPVGWDD
jgi:hypothetical protein